jgi:hypothetical protein
VLLGIALTAGGLGLALNVAHGVEPGLAPAVAFGLADLAKITIPLVAGLIGWSRQLKITAVIFNAVSLWSATNVYLDGAGAALLAKQHGVESYADKTKEIAGLELEVARLTTLASAEAGKGGCGPNCRALNEQASVASGRLSAARQAKASAKPAEISSLAAILSMLNGAGQDEIGRAIGVVKAALFLLLIEALVWLSVPAMTLLSQAARRDAIATPAATGPVATEFAKPCPATIFEVATPVAKGGRNYYAQRLQRGFPALAARVQAGELSVHAASILAGLRKPAVRKKLTPADFGVPADA